MGKKSEPILYKAFFQVTIKPELKFYDLLYKAATEVTGFPHWETNRLNVVLRDPESRCSIVISHNAISYEQDASEASMEALRIRSAFPSILRSLAVETVTSFHHRNIYLLDLRVEFAELAKLMNIKLFSQNDRLQKCLPGTMSDFRYEVHLAEGQTRYNILAAPVWKEQILQLLRFNKDNHLTPEKPEAD